MIVQENDTNEYYINTINFFSEQVLQAKNERDKRAALIGYVLWLKRYRDFLNVENI